MYTKAMRNVVLKNYNCAKWALSSKHEKVIIDDISGFLRFQYPYDYSKPTVNKSYPGPHQQEALNDAQSYNLDQTYQVSSKSN